MASLSKQEIPPWGLAIAGSTGAVLANALVYPLDIVKTRLQVQVKRKPSSTRHSDDLAETNQNVEPIPLDRHYHGTWHAIASIMEDEGLEGLYSGILGSLIGVASTNFAYFYWYSVVRSTYFERIQKTSKNPSTIVELSLGAIAGALAQMFTIPIAVVTTRQQTQPKGQKKGMLATAGEVIDTEDGITGLWRGFKASLFLVVNPSITYGAYQRLREILYPNKSSLRPHEAFLLGAISKTLATIATQPLIVAKVGLQSRPPPERRGKPFKSFTEVMRHIVDHEGIKGLFKGIGPQIIKGLLVQGILMTIKERMELVFILLFRYVRRVRHGQMQKLAAIAAQAAEKSRAGTSVV